MRTAICPGSFDPITVGHLDLAERAAAIFDEVVVCVMVNGEKRTMFTPRQRLEMVRAAVGHLPNVRAALWEGQSDQTGLCPAGGRTGLGEGRAGRHRL